MQALRIDAHQHCWRLDRGDYDWLQSGGAALHPLRRDFLPDDLWPLLAASDVDRTVLVQAAASAAETDFLLGLSQAEPAIGGVVGWADLSHPGSVATLQRWSSLHPAFKGVRPMLQDLPQPDWIEHAPHPEVLQAVADLGLRLDALVLPQHLQPLRRFLRSRPELPVVIDHAAKPPLHAGLASPACAAWRRDLAALADLPWVHCKVSGWLTLLPASGLAPAEPAALLRPLWHEVLSLFGPRRLMWGSDWPVLTLAAGYPDWVEVSRLLIGELEPAEQAEVWGGTAARFYGLSGVAS